VSTVLPVIPDVFATVVPLPSAPSEELRQLAADPSYGSRASLLLEVAGAVDGGPTAELWAELDILDVLDVAGPLDDVREESRSSRRLELARTVLIFCPLLITWAGLYVAGKAYGALLGADPAAAQRPFLKLWLNGFDGRTRFSLDRLALVSTILIGLLVVVSVLIERRRQSDDARFEVIGRRQRQRLRAAAVQAQLALVRHRLSSPARFREEITKSSKAFGAVAKQISSITTVVTTSLVDLGLVAERLEAASSSTAVGAHDMGEATERFLAVVGTLERKLDANTQTLQQSVRASGDLLSLSVDRSSAAVDDAVQQSTRQLTGLVEQSSGWVVSSAEALLAHGDRSLSWAERTFDEIGRTIGVLQGRLDEALARDVSSTDFRTATQQAVAEIAAVRFGLDSLARAVQDLATRNLPGELEDGTRRAAAALDGAVARLEAFMRPSSPQYFGPPSEFAAQAAATQ
jgi:hypothetical protein